MGERYCQVWRRRWVWPLRSGLMTVLALTGFSSWMTQGCGGSMESSPQDAGGGRIAQTGGGQSSIAGTKAAGGSLIVGGTTTRGTSPQCVLERVDSAVFSEQAFQPSGIMARVLYSWTTPEQAAELRNRFPLFSRSERPDKGRGNALTELEALGAANAYDSELARLLSQKYFLTARYAWTNPWATRMGWPDEQYGNQLVRIELTDQAWVAHFDGQNLSVYDELGAWVDTARALANAQRIGAIYYVRGASVGGPECGTFGSQRGSFGGPLGGGPGYREIILGNLAMVKRYSLGTVEMADRIAQDIEKLTSFANALSQCVPLALDSDWNSYVTCLWQGNGYQAPSNYLNALAIPSDYYQPTVENIVNIVETLKNDDFTVSPCTIEVN